MLKITTDTIHAFSQAASEDFERRLLTHLREVFPEQFGSLGPSAVQSHIRNAMASAAEYKITSEQGVCLYVDLSFAFGDGFDRRLPWVKQVLNDGRITTESERLTRLRLEASLHDDEVVAFPRRIHT